jgi:DNA polymerase-1
VRKLDWEKEHELRSMANAVIQGSAATIIKKAMIELHERLKHYDAKIILQVHDELLIECSKEDVKKVNSIIKEFMLNPKKDFCVPFEVDVKEGRNWGETHA